ncbi:hypothetical protein GV819_16945 [Pseudomonas sp. Fl5BN2]|uniref:hypothetical protein n=1 Tax=unclassified Pseudomonas TaxID=196821 RepID=UPI00137734E6|nr:MULTISPECIES: hypothetical protein [unclassified Pseudomonas]NBF03981.1 hypothetical protein [Pseudomonas sp. Fl5BN2]NBF09774.1 hypothetical protein [Pseudomonas sp. Fl4BN1]
MTVNAKIDALEHLVVALLREGKKRHGIEPDSIFEKAESSIMGSNGPGTTHKAEAMKELKHLRSLLS